MIGSTLPGVPGVILGRNNRIAWGFTNTGPDVQDLFIEKLDAAGGYVAPDGPRPFQVVDEIIRVKGGEPEKLRVRISRHGPVISDVLKAAQDESPQQNIVYADIEGNIGFIAAGRVPHRRATNDLKGMAPAPGWQEKYDWAGTIPFEQLPRSFNPPSGAIVTANHRITPPGYPHFISSEWEPPFRADRIQADVTSLAMRELLPKLLAARPRSEEARQALALLAQWDGAMAPERAEPFANRHAASLRAIYDLSDLEKSLYIHSGGQSGNILSDHYKAFSEAWAKNEYIPMRAERKTLDAEPHQLLKLVPAR